MPKRPSRREARIEREALKKLTENDKSARLVGAVSARQVRTKENPDSIFSMTMTWSSDCADCDEYWSWGECRKWDNDTWKIVILPKLSEFGKLRWSEIDTFSSDTGHKMHHNMDTEVICDEAIMRLIDIEQYEDTIFRFRLGNKRRLWGFRTVAHFEILWYDGFHKIYPTDPD